MILVIIKDNNAIHSFYLEDSLNYKNISIYSNEHNYYITLKGDYYFEDNSKQKLLRYCHYTILSRNVYYPIELYVYNHNDNIDNYRLYENTDILIAHNNQANIYLNDQYLNDYYLSITNGVIKSNFDLVINGSKYNNDLLIDGDIIDFLAIRIIYFNDFLYINGFNIDVKIKELEINESKFKYKDNQLIKHHSFNCKIEDLNYEEIKEFNTPQYKDNNSFSTIFSSIVMCAATCLMAVVNYYNNPNKTNILIYIVMPISMIITSILIPVVIIVTNKISYKKNYKLSKSSYLKYLSDYYDENLIKKEEYLKQLNSTRFSFDRFNQSLFRINSNSYNFLDIEVAYIEKKINIKHKLTNDEDIDRKIIEIINKLSIIDNYPLYLDLKKYKNVTVSCNKINIQNIFNYYLLYLSLTHNYDDINIAIYSSDKKLLSILFNLPHLLLNKKRLIISNQKELIELDQSHLDKPLIIFMNVHCEYEFKNNNIHVLYFSCENDVYKNSHAKIEYKNNEGSIYLDKKIDFKYIENNINYYKYFDYLSFYKITTNKAKATFKSIFGNDIESLYQNNNHTLQASFAYIDNEVLLFDLHESKQGPHGLIGGSTGSGKSELIVSLLLSLCIRYAPDYLNIVLIDYKGGGIKDSLTFNGISIPHIVASIDNLQDNAFERFIICLKNECKRRQTLFKKMSSISNNSIMNLDDYLYYYNEDYELDKLSHLLIVVDEFAELKKENPELIKELISLSRIGRSLGLHLILATQKPAGVIDEEIWSNSRFKIALKTFEEKDSNDLLRSKDAAYLNEAGSFILKLGDNSIKANSIYTKSDINNNDSYKVSTLNNDLSINLIYTIANSNFISTSMYYCEKIISTVKKLNIKTHKLDFKAPVSKSRKDLLVYKHLVLGQIDDYINDKHGVLYLPIKENTLIVSNRKNEINAILNTLNESQTDLIVIGSNTYQNEYIHDSLLYEEQEDIVFIFNYLLNNNLNITLLIEDISVLLSYDETYVDYLYKLLKRKNNTNVIGISSSCQLHFKLINYFKNKILINANDYSDLTNLYGMRSKYKGNSFYYNEEPISFIPIQIEEFVKGNKSESSYVKHIPETINSEVENDKYLAGYNLDTKEKVFITNDIAIYSYDIEALDKYRAYKDISIEQYTNKTKRNSKNILWLGTGIYSQNIFIPNVKSDLNDNEGLLLMGNKYIKIRILNYE